jgi:two-component system, chemotaxis family, sensor kinase CheA
MAEAQQLVEKESAVAAWKARIETLATRLMIDGEGPEAATELRALGQEARQGGAAAAADLAEELAAGCEQNQARGVEQLLKGGLEQLWKALERGTAEVVSAPPASLGEDAELVADFLVEAREHLSQIEGQMLALERDPAAMEVIHAVFRAFHTIKGLAGFLDFGAVQAVAHEVETLLDLARNAKLAIDSAIVDVILESADFLLTELASIEETLQSGAPWAVADHRDLLARIRNLAVPQSGAAGSGLPDAVEKELPPAMEATTASRLPMEELSFPTEEAPAPEPVFVSAPATVTNAAPTPEPVSDSAPNTVTNTAPAPAAGTPRAAAAKEPARSGDAGSVRVDTAKLDYLMDMVGEIVVAQSLVRHNQALGSLGDSRLSADLAQLARVTAEVQRATMSMRMVPVGQLFQRVERVIRDLSRKAGKQVVLETSGTETEIDKTVAEELSDPLLHMVRNSVDHGVEPVEERIAAGKAPEARIRLSAFHQGGQVIIQISDDGRGLNAEKIRRKAEERKLISPTAQLTETEMQQLIFEPGFSTAEQITDVSGRGVGMDVVRRNVEKLRGRIETQSTLGQGTTFLLKLPLTLAIIDGLVVEIGAERYILPLAGVREIFRPQADTLFTVQGRDEMVLVRDQLMPVIRLYQRLNIAAGVTDPSQGLLVVVESDSRHFCLLIDDLVGKQEVVIKGLGEAFSHLPGISGCAVLGDGRVGLILDMHGIYRGLKR